MRWRRILMGAVAIGAVAACTSLEGLSGAEDGGVDASLDSVAPPPDEGGTESGSLESGAPDGCTGGCAVPKTLCSEGTCVSPSCAGLAATCGATHDTDCCSSIRVSGFRFAMGRSTDGGIVGLGGNGNDRPSPPGEAMGKQQHGGIRNRQRIRNDARLDLRRHEHVFLQFFAWVVGLDPRL
jgi:hypothetical protein